MMIFVLPIFSVLYGLLLHYEIFVPKIYRGSGLFYIGLGIFMFLLIPFLRSLGTKEEKILYKKYRVVDSCCFPIYLAGISILGIYLLEIYVNDFMFVLSILIMSFCRNIEKFIKNRTN